MTKYCPDCGETLIDEAKFCKNCGKKLDEFNSTKQSHENNVYSAELPKIEKSHTIATALGFILALFGSPLAIIFAIYLITRKDNPNSKKYGILIIILTFLILIIAKIIIRY